jgi:hypothetical protein
MVLSRLFGIKIHSKIALSLVSLGGVYAELVEVLGTGCFFGQTKK